MTVVRESVVSAPIAEVWSRVISPEGINHELRPWATMRMPRGAQSLTIEAAPIGEPIGRAWLLLFGIIPIDYDRLMLTEVVPGRSFREDSTMLSMRRWQHHRTLTPLDDRTTVVRDELDFEPRMALKPAGPIFRRIVGALFTHRHRRLNQHFGR